MRLPGRPLRTLTDVGGYAIRRSALHDALFFAATSVDVRLRSDEAIAIAHTRERASR